MNLTRLRNFNEHRLVRLQNFEDFFDQEPRAGDVDEKDAELLAVEHGLAPNEFEGIGVELARLGERLFSRLFALLHVGLLEVQDLDDSVGFGDSEEQLADLLEVLPRNHARRVVVVVQAHVRHVGLFVQIPRVVAWLLIHIKKVY